MLDDILKTAVGQEPKNFSVAQRRKCDKCGICSV